MRQSGDLLEKLKIKHPTQVIFDCVDSASDDINYHHVSEANAELVRTGAKLSLEDTEADNFTLIAEAFYDSNKNNVTESSHHLEHNLINSNMVGECNMPLIDKNVPSPSEILKNLCLSKNESLTGNREERDDIDYNMYKDFSLFL